MLKMADLLKGKDFDSLDQNVKGNLQDLLLKVQKLERLYKMPFTITSGLRTKEDQIRVYKEKGITDIKKIPMGSKHLTGQACDISDIDFKITNFCKAHGNEALVNCQLFAEDDVTVRRLHVQTVKVPSGNMWFKP